MFFRSENITIKFGGLVANNNVSISIEKGQVMGLIGPNGAGKSTFFKAVNGFNIPTSGDVFFEDKKITGQTTWDTCRDGITSTFQLAETFPASTVLDTVMVGAYCRTKSDRQAKEKALEAMEFMKLTDVRNKRNNELNLFTRKRVEVCAALATEPKLFLLDEIFAGCTLSEDEELIELIQRINGEKGITIFLVEHVLKVVHELCDQVVVLDHGEIIATGTPEEVTRMPQVITAYLGEDYVNA